MYGPGAKPGAVGQAGAAGDSGDGGDGGGGGGGGGGYGGGGGGSGGGKAHGEWKWRRTFVHNATLMRARPFSGYHAGERLFVRLQLYDPSSVSRAADAMFSGGILNRRFQPHESHMPYLLQVMVDNNPL
jgi:hypothetical protein